MEVMEEMMMMVMMMMAAVMQHCKVPELTGWPAVPEGLHRDSAS